jgi:CheY-like chemotaxis protein
MTVLAVDDEPDLLEAIRRVLTRQGHTVLCASSAAEALLLCHTHPDQIDLLLTDLRMPGGGGGELAARAGETRPGLRVLFMSGLADATGLSIGAGSGLLDAPVLAKPFTPQKLAEAVDNALGARTRP